MLARQKEKPKIDFPQELQFLFEPSRYKIAYGGRGGMKSWAFARALLIMGAQRPLRILCAREIQKSIKDSVHKLLKDQVNLLGLNSRYIVQQNTIKGTNGTELFFEGLRHNSLQIKSYEGIDIVWIEEAVGVSRASWKYLVPTIRKEDSEIWVSYNPELEEDETHQRFVINPPKNSVVVKVGWQDNPWITQVLLDEMENDKARVPEEEYLNTWEGRCRAAVEGAIYPDELHNAQEEGRITTVPYEKTKPVFTFWDFGYSDMTSIWFIQKVGFELRVIDFYQANHKGPDHFVTVLQNKGYVYGTDYIPHDGAAKTLAANGKSLKAQFEGMGRTVEVVPKGAVYAGIAATRLLFNRLWFDKEKCADGIQALRRYRYEKNADSGRTGKNPLHDENSHAADGLRTFGMADVAWDKAELYTPPSSMGQNDGGWQGR